MSMEILLDFCAIMAVIADEPESDAVINLTKGAVLSAPDVVSFEIANGLTKMMKKKIIGAQDELLNLYRNFERIPIREIKADLEKSLEIAWEYKIYVYDAIYLEIAKRRRLPLLTFDSGMRRVGKEIGITMLGG